MGIKVQIDFKRKKKQESTWLTLSEEQKVEMENTNIESTSDLMEATTKLKVEYVDNITTSTRNYSEIGDDDVWELVPEVEI